MTSLEGQTSPEVHSASNRKKLVVFLLALTVLAVVIWVLSGTSKSF
jgi:hypothetical protein